MRGRYSIETTAEMITKNTGLLEGRSLGFVGGGNMAAAIIDGLLRECSADSICVYDKSPERMALMAEKGCRCAESVAALAESCDTILLAVKPQNFEDVFAEARDAIAGDKLFISIAAGVPISRIRQLAGNDSLRVVRVMPNVNVLVKAGAAVIAAQPPAGENDLTFTEQLLRAAGFSVEVIEEEQINAATSLHGSGPAFVFLFARAAADYAVSMGIDEGMAFRLFCQTLRGSADLMEMNGSCSMEECDRLIRMVTSPKGTTEAALKDFESNGLYKTLLSGFNACARRAEELGS
ncbi:MAG: pyrroline-5-carboxylate reductase [Ruminococcaceae bacterium]|nr:pyrroline-5-carboxylate reductase [Oscillospiraceae bacterium]